MWMRYEVKDLERPRVFDFARQSSATIPGQRLCDDAQKGNHSALLSLLV